MYSSFSLSLSLSLRSFSPFFSSFYSHSVILPLPRIRQAPHTLFYYKKGILTCAKKPRSEPGWKETNHAVTIVGYGVDTKNYKHPIKYWIIQNTWGPKFGDRTLPKYFLC
jgi:hypothetical protein